MLLQTSISGENVGYIYMEAALYDEESDSFVVVDRDFVMADTTEEVEGVAYPVWTEKDLDDFIFEWTPTVYAISDGESEAFDCRCGARSCRGRVQGIPGNSITARESSM